jgi:hypothetical protein
MAGLAGNRSILGMRKTRKGNDTQQKKQERIPDPEARSCNPESSARIEKDLEEEKRIQIRKQRQAVKERQQKRQAGNWHIANLTDS